MNTENIKQLIRSKHINKTDLIRHQKNLKEWLTIDKHEQSRYCPFNMIDGFYPNWCAIYCWYNWPIKTVRSCPCQITPTYLKCRGVRITKYTNYIYARDIINYAKQIINKLQPLIDNFSDIKKGIKK